MRLYGKPDMVSHMKTTIVLPDDLFAQVKRTADARGITIKSLIELAIRDALTAEEGTRPEFRLRDCSVGGEGPTPEFRDGDWATLRRAIYEGRGE
jgi:hypothetical protein